VDVGFVNRCSSFQTQITFCQITKLSLAKDHPDYAGKATPAHNITTAKIKEEALGNSNIGGFDQETDARKTKLQFPDRRLVRM
jgi:2-oxo-4-hydroxy-4-carboxy--5-ureidoimidazoline (OHCU) decarboxylase